MWLKSTGNERESEMIKITDDYCIGVDDWNYAVFKLTGSIDKKTGEPYKKIIGYFGNMRDALIAVVEKVLTESVTTDETLSLGEALERINKAYTEISEVIRTAVPNPDAYESRTGCVSF